MLKFYRSPPTKERNIPMNISENYVPIVLEDKCSKLNELYSYVAKHSFCDSYSFHGNFPFQSNLEFYSYFLLSLTLSGSISNTFSLKKQESSFIIIIFFHFFIVNFGSVISNNLLL